jgi:peptide-methionine (S)-S-oxide reductase
MNGPDLGTCGPSAALDQSAMNAKTLTFGLGILLLAGGAGVWAGARTAPVQTRAAAPAALQIADATADSPELAAKKGHEIAVFGGGCFWCTERDFRKVKGIRAADVGYMGGSVDRPTYEMVCTGATGHVEVTRVEFDPKMIAYKDVVRAFFKMHDPTQGNRQGPDHGEQYRSVIFTYSDAQAAQAKEILAEVQAKLPRKITTTIEPAKKYWRAEEYHQQYYRKLGIG